MYVDLALCVGKNHLDAYTGTPTLRLHSLPIHGGDIHHSSVYNTSRYKGALYSTYPFLHSANINETRSLSRVALRTR